MENGVKGVYSIGCVEVPTRMTAVAVESEFSIAGEEKGEFGDDFYTFLQQLVEVVAWRTISRGQVSGTCFQDTGEDRKHYFL